MGRWGPTTPTGVNFCIFLCNRKMSQFCISASSSTFMEVGHLYTKTDMWIDDFWYITESVQFLSLAQQYIYVLPDWRSFCSFLTRNWIWFIGLAERREMDGRNGRKSRSSPHWRLQVAPLSIGDRCSYGLTASLSGSDGIMYLLIDAVSGVNVQR